MIVHRLEKTITPGNRTFPEPRNAAGFQKCIVDKNQVVFLQKTPCLYAFWAFFFLIVRIAGVWFEGKNLCIPYGHPGCDLTGHVDVDKFLDATNMESECSGDFLDFWGNFSHIAWKFFNQQSLDFFRSSFFILEIFSDIFYRVFMLFCFPFERGFGLMYSIAFQSMCLMQNNYFGPGKEIISTSGDLTKKRWFDIGKSFVECYWFIVLVLVCLSVSFGWFFFNPLIN